MKRKNEAQAEEHQGIWVRDQLYLSLQILSAQAQDQIHHFPSHSAIIQEMIMDYVHFAESIQTYWILSQEQTHQLMLLKDFLLMQDSPENSDFWTEEALFSDPRWNKVRDLAKLALTSLQWPIETPHPE